MTNIDPRMSSRCALTPEQFRESFSDWLACGECDASVADIIMGLALHGPDSQAVSLTTPRYAAEKIALQVTDHHVKYFSTQE